MTSVKIQQIKCPYDQCDKTFTRQCDFRKHEKAHLRPYKCFVSGCKYELLGLPSEKERDRHMDDRHAATHKRFKCYFCAFRTKRESNCKQHMEKKHAWTYSRTKGERKALERFIYKNEDRKDSPRSLVSSQVVYKFGMNPVARRSRRYSI